MDVHFIHVRSRARERAAGDHHARLARLGDRDARDRSGRSPTRPRTAGAPRTRSTSSSPPSPGYGLSARADRAGVVGRPRRAGLARADEAPRLRPLRRPGRRRGRRRHRRDGPHGPGGAARHPHEPVRARSRGRQVLGRDRGGEGRERGDGDSSGRPASATSSSSRRGRRRSATACSTRPVELAAWLLDHDTDAYYKIASAFVEDKPSGNLTRDHILDNITLYWLTGTGASAARSYWESAQATAEDAPGRLRLR